MKSMLRHVDSYLNQIKGNIIDKKVGIENVTVLNCGYKKNNDFPSLDGFKPFEDGEEWGTGIDSHVWFHFNVSVPEDMRGNDTLELHVSTDFNGWDANNPQFICYVDGVMRQGFDTNHRTLLLGGDKNEYDVYLYAYTGPRIEKSKLHVFLQTINSEVREYYYNMLVPRQALDCIADNTFEYQNTLNVLSCSLRKLNMLEPRGKEFFDSVKEANKYLSENLYANCDRSNINVVCIGHTHIDIAWLWTVEQTREKAQRSFSTVIELMKRYPEYKFMSSQAYLYKAVKEEAPELYAEIKKMIKAGRWEVEGAMWVEADCNLPSGESLVRQILYGKRFFKDEFGVDSRVLWLPDVFGYSAALPQILKKSGVDWFVTSKISWNDLNVMPYDVFKWEGIDGTKINTYFLTAQRKGKTTNFDRGTTYVAFTNPDMIAGSYNRFQQKELSNESIVTYGYGDGGGGPTYEMLEIGKRQQNGVCGLPNVKFDFAGDMLKRLEKNVEGNPRLPKWRGELYLEYHRGTYTSNAKNKKNNRNCEFLALDGEYLSTAAKALLGQKYPKEELKKIWECMLVNQFHDIIPGSSIREVYEVCDREYAEVRGSLGQIIENAENTLASSIKTDKRYIVFNPHSFVGNGTVWNGGRSYFVKDVPQKGWKAVDLTESESGISFEGNAVESKYYSVRFDEFMNISSVYDKINGREIIEDGKKANELRVFEDYPDCYDAWEIQEFSGYKYYTVDNFSNLKVTDEGASLSISIERKHGESRINQSIRFYSESPRIDFETTLDWHSKHRILRSAFPVNINTDKATFEIQFGNIERPTHKNTSWDRMKFETCGHKFVDMSEGNYGVSLLNDCKYGHDVHDNVMQLTLLKCPSEPNEVADEGIHHFTYSLLPHSGCLCESATLSEAYFLNYPMTVVKADEKAENILPESYSFVSVNKPNIVIETVKETENGEAVIIRAYEAMNCTTSAEIKLGFKAKKISLCDMLENETKKIEENTDCFVLPFKPYEIVTVKVEK